MSPYTRCRHSWLALAFGLLLIGFSGQAKAQTSKAERARKLVVQARALMEGERWEEASVVYLKAHDLVPDPVLLWNAARCKESAGSADDAISLYSQLEADKKATDAWKEKARLQREALQAPPTPKQFGPMESVEPRGPTTPEPEDPIDPRITPDKGLMIGGWTSVGIGLALTVTGGALLGVAQADYDDGRAADTYRAARSHQDDGDTMTYAGWAMLGVGSAALITGTALLIVDATRGDDADANATISMVPSLILKGDHCLALGMSWYF